MVGLIVNDDYLVVVEMILNDDYLVVAVVILNYYMVARQVEVVATVV